MSYGKGIVRTLVVASVFALSAGIAVAQSGRSSGPTPGMVFIRGGSFLMGSPESEPGRLKNEGPQHKVTVSDFWIGRLEVSMVDYDEYCVDLGLPLLPDRGYGRAEMPATSVNWLDAVSYCNWRSKKEGLKPCYFVVNEIVYCDWASDGYRLPTEAEWEYACRAGTTTAWNTGPTISIAQANFHRWEDFPEMDRTPVFGIAGMKLTPSGRADPNPWGLYDMHGNAAEWCWDLYAPYESGAAVDPRGAETADPEKQIRVIRGGSWSQSGRNARSASRSRQYDWEPMDFVGFRLARSQKKAR